jgi:hypothetical protein
LPLVISNAQLRSAYLTEPMYAYFRRKVGGISDADLEARIEEALKFLFISGECTGAIPVTKEIDEIWHYWVLETQEYAALCEALPAGAFVHHSSNDYLAYFDPSVGEDTDLAADVKMLALYVENFGPFDASRTKYWHLATHLVDKMGWSVEQLNEWLFTPDADPIPAV